MNEYERMVEMQIEEWKEKRSWQRQAEERFKRELDTWIQCEIDFAKEGVI